MQHQFYKRQQGFTLLELLVVITLLAVLSVGALVAYEGSTEKAQGAAAANNLSTLDQSVRAFRSASVNDAYPNQWDNLSLATSTSSVPFLDATSQGVFGDWNVGAGAASGVGVAVANALARVGITDIQQVTAQNGVLPNEAHNEGANPTGAAEITLVAAGVLDAAFDHISILPHYGDGYATPGACTAGGQTISGTYSVPVPNATEGTDVARRANRINDHLEDDECALVLALGFGHDAAHSTAGGAASVTTAATHTSAAINPNTDYARYVGLFLMGADDDGDKEVASGEINNKPIFLGFVTPEGTTADAAAAGASAN